MKLLIDNTGLQSSGMCLQGKPRNENDVKNLIQLGTLLVFSNELIVNSIGATSGTQESKKVINYLAKIGVEKTVIKQDGDEKLFWLACERAAEAASVEILSILSGAGDIYDLSTGVSTDVVPIGYPVQDIKRTWDLFLRVGESSVSKDELLAEKEIAKSFYTSGATDYMLAHSEKLQESVRMLMKEKKGENWSIKDIFHLQVFLRAYLNDIVAKDQGACYTPSVTRAQYIRKENTVILMVRAKYKEIKELPRESKVNCIGVAQ
jgi:hypothetical protein